MKHVYLSLILSTNQEEFNDFLDESRGKIYELIYTLFEQLHEQNIENGTVNVSAIINGYDWNHDIDFNISQFHEVLKVDLLPYFEKTEDYEMCAKIKKLCDQLTTKSS